MPANIDWEYLLQSISERKVVPIIGNELYQSESGNLEDYIIDQLWTKLVKTGKKPHPASPASIIKAVEILKNDYGYETYSIIRELKGIISNANKTFPVFQDLLSVQDINFYVNTTIYGLLEKAILNRGNITSIDFSISSKIYDCESIDNLQQPVVFNVFGSLFGSIDPAITEEEMLEYTASFTTKMSVSAINILDALKNKTLLFIGCTQPEWMIRFLLRVISNERIHDWQQRKSKIIIINNDTRYHETHYHFLNTHKAVTYIGNNRQFIRELTSRWNLFKPQKPKVIFISYNNRDLSKVENFCRKIMDRMNNIICKYDQTEIHSGDDFAESIIDNLAKADIVIPIISKNSCSDNDDAPSAEPGYKETYVHREWEWIYNMNIMRKRQRKKECRFIMPVAIDDVPRDHHYIQKFFPRINVEIVLNAEPGDDFLNRLSESLICN
jgi:hypothetical protein